MRLNQKKILVVGLGKSGLSVVRYLVGAGARVTVSDMKREGDLEPGMVQEMRNLGVTLETGGHTIGTFTRCEQIIVSPGVPPGMAMLRTSYMASHEDHHLDKILDAFGIIGKKLGIIA